MPLFIRQIIRCMAVAACLCATLPAFAQNDADERISQECEPIYAKLCKGIAPGPEMIGKCNRARPDVSENVPAKCTTDFQNKVEGYEDVMRENGGK